MQTARSVRLMMRFYKSSVSDVRCDNLLIAVCADGASVNMGRISGACTVMK